MILANFCIEIHADSSYSETMANPSIKRDALKRAPYVKR